MLNCELTVKDCRPPGCVLARREQQGCPALLFATGGGKEYLVKAVQVLAFQVFYYLVIKLPGFSEGGPGQGHLVAMQGETGLAPRRGRVGSVSGTFRSHDIPCALSAEGPGGDRISTFIRRRYQNTVKTEECGSNSTATERPGSKSAC